MPSIHFSSVVILESLAKNKTGRQLYEDLRPITIQADRDIDIKYFEVDSKEALLTQLHSIEQDANKDDWPILHIECHGLDDTTGISLANGDSLSWAELKPYLTAINIATQCNLLVVMAACYGGHMVQIIQPVERAPCLAMLSPTKEIYFDEILKPLTTFYRELFNSLDLNAALIKLYSYPIVNGGYYFQTADDFFKSIYVGYIKGCADQKGFKIKDRAKNIYLELKRSANPSPVGIGAIKKMLKQTQPVFFKSYYERFFMIDIYPSNKSRFDITYDKILEEAKAPLS
ncbi:hypothetical protein [Chlorobium sp. N1]|uniref:hypothetical protein n=1 Tax=Chlorobium sp. N1 TaxID=2491138 RepID=UPI001038E002|nr:hypothetical protein [Chlorobium sp. N1]TCD46822.1 hypothetical protein E0L29_11310 [Chlorobium sp. N1]